MILLFLLSTIHISLAYTWAFITDRAQTGVYELFSLDNPLPVLYGPDDPAIVRRLGILIKIRYTLANTIADGIFVHRCYVIWGRNWRPVALPAFAYACTLIGGILGIIPLSGTSERVATAVCMATIFCTNVLAASLAAGKIAFLDVMDDILRLFTLCDATVNLLLFQRCPDLLPRVGTITHLDLYGVAGVDAGDRRGWGIWSRLAEMPCLTHLSVQNRAFAGNLYYGTLRDCKSLEALAVIFSNANILEAFVASYAALATDPRLVMLVVMNRPRDWEMGAKGDEDSWVRVDELVRRRRSGETKEYFIIEDPSSYPRTT
ncbi:hypothetical protein C8R44DRAFT_866039 [Mycena epipterygia]|nr:hypothetical protein C8R44DRAFT_866039 [Mycena epipterygia]